MKKYECEGQMSIFDLIVEVEEQPKVPLDSDWPPIIKALDAELRKMFKPECFSNDDEDFRASYCVWEHVKNLGKRYCVFINKVYEWDLNEIISRYKTVNLEISVNVSPSLNDEADVDGNDLMISTLWKTSKHKESLADAPTKSQNAPKTDLNSQSGINLPQETETTNKAKICVYSKHECNKAELWKVADMMASESSDVPICPHVCCRLCAVKECGARCNGSEEPKEAPKNAPRAWHRLIKQAPTQSGFYEVMNTDGIRNQLYYDSFNAEFDTWYIALKEQTVECWREHAPEVKKDKASQTIIPEHMKKSGRDVYIWAMCETMTAKDSLKAPHQEHFREYVSNPKHINPQDYTDNFSKYSEDCWKAFRRSYFEFSNTLFFYVDGELFAFEKSGNDNTCGRIYHCGTDKDVVLATVFFRELYQEMIERIKM